MANRAKNAQYAYGITIEVGNYNEVINGFEKRLKNLDKVTKTTTATFASLSEAMKSGKQVDFSKAEGQLTGLVAEMEEVAKWREQLAGGQKLSDMFDGLEQVKQSLGQVTGQLDKFGDNIEEIFSILQNVPQNTSKTFVDIRKVLSQTASDMNKIIAELNNPTEKTDVSALKNQLSGLATDFVNEWNKAASQGIKMDQVVDFKPFATIIKSAISGARSLGAEFNDVSASVTEATKNVVALYSVKHPTGMFKDIVSGMASVETQSKKAEQAASKVGASFKAAISIVDKLNKSDMGLAKKSREMDEFLAKLKNPEITIDLKNKDDKAIEDEFKRLEQVFDDIVGDNDITPDFLKNLPVDKLKELGTTLQNIVAIGRKFPKLLDIGDDVPMNEIIGLYSSDLKKIVAEIKKELDEVNALIAESGKTLKSQLEALGLKDIELQVKLADLTGDKVSEYVKQLNGFVDTLTGQLANKGAIELPVNIQVPGITPDNVESKKAKDIIKSAIDEYSKVAADVSSSENTIKDARNKTVSKIISGAFGSNDNLDLYLSYIKEQFSKIRETVKRQKKEIQDMLSLDFSWNKENAANSFSNLFVDLQDYFSDPENAIKVEIDKKYLVDRIKDAFSTGGVDLKLSSSGTPMDQSQLVAAIVAAFGGSLPTTRKATPAATRQTTSSSSQSPVTENDVKSRFVFNIKEFMSKYSGELSEGLNQTLENIVSSVKDIAKTANGSRIKEDVRAKIQAAFGSLDLSKVAQMTNEEIVSWVQNALLRADESGRAIGADLPDILKNTKVSWKSVSNFSNALKQLFIKIENETRDVENAARDRQKVSVLKDFGYRARAINSRSSVLRKLNKNELDGEFLTAQLEKLQSVKTYKDSIPDGKGGGVVRWLDKAIAIYQELINISNGKTVFDTEAEKQEEITRLREELSGIRVSDDKTLIETLAGNIAVSKKYKNGTTSRGKRREFSGSSRGLEKALSLIENAGDDGIITIRFTSTPNDKAMREWLETENEYGKQINTRRRSRDGNLRGEGKSSLISEREDRENILEQKIYFKPFSQSREPIDWDEYESGLQRRLQENEDALNEQKNIVDKAKKNLTSANRKKSLADKKVFSYTDDRWIDAAEDILGMASEDKKSGLNDKSIKQLSKLVKSSYNKDSKNFEKAYAQAEKDLRVLMSEEASEDNVARIKSLLDFIENLNKAAENYSSAAKYVDKNFVINEKIDKSLFESASKRVSDAGEIKKVIRYGAELPHSDVGKYVASIKRKEDIEKFAGYSSDYQEYIKSLLDNALDSLNKAAQDKDTPANRKKIQGILQYINDLKTQFDQFKEIERKIYEAYDFGKSKPDVKFEDLSSKDNIVETYKKAKEVLQERIKEIDRELTDINKQKGGIKHYTEEQKTLAKLELDASQYYSKVSNIRQLENSIKNAKTEDQRNSLTQLLQKESNKEVISPLKQVENISSFIEELSKKLSSDKLSTEEKGVLSSVLKEATALLGELKSVRSGGQTPMFAMSKSRYEDIIADNTAEEERIAEAERKALARRAKVVEELDNLEKSSLGAEALRRASSVRRGESYRSEAISADADKSSAQSVLIESKERLRLLEKEREALQLEKEKAAEKKKYNNLLVQEKRLKEEIATLEKNGVSSEEKKAELTKLQARIAKQEKKLGINFEEVSTSMTKEDAFSMASEYDAQEKLLRSQIRALESKVESAQELIDSLTARGFNSAKGEAEVRRFSNDKVSEFKNSDYFKAKKDKIRDKYLKGVYKEDGTIDSSDSLEGKIRELADKYSKDIDKIYFNIADVKEGNAQEFLDALVGDQTRFSNAFKGNRNVGQKFMADYEEFKSFYWELIREEESKVVDDYKKSIKVDKHNGTVSYTSYDGDTIQEVVVDLKSQIIQRLKEQIEAEIKPILSEKTNLLGRVSESKKQALEFAGLKESEITSIRNADVDDKIAAKRSKIASLRNTDIVAKDRDIKSITDRYFEDVDEEHEKDKQYINYRREAIKEISELEGRIAINTRKQDEKIASLKSSKSDFLKGIKTNGIASSEEIQAAQRAVLDAYNRDYLDKNGKENKKAREKAIKKAESAENRVLAGKVAFERFKINARNEYLSSNDYATQVQSINNKYYGKNENGKSQFEQKTAEIVDKYKDKIYKVLINSTKYTENEINDFLSYIQKNPETYSDTEEYFKLKNPQYRDMVQTLVDDGERVWRDMTVSYRSISETINEKISSEVNDLLKNYMKGFSFDNENNTITYTSYASGNAVKVVENLREKLYETIEREITDILSGNNIYHIVGDAVEASAKSLVELKNNGPKLQKQFEDAKSRKDKIDAHIANGTFSEDDQKEIDKLLKEKKAIEDQIAVLEKEIEAWEFVKKAREESIALDRKTDQEREATELSKIERYEQGIAEKKEKQKKLQEELNILRGAEEKDIDAIDRKEGELEEVSKKIVELEQKKQRSENNLGRIHERMENAKMSTTSSSGGGILSPIINLLSEIRDMLSKISGVPTKSGGDTSGSSPSSGGKTKSEINSMLSKYWQKKNGKSATKEEWEQLKKDYVDGKLTDLDEVLAQEVQAKIEKEKKEDSKPVTKNADTKKSDERFSNILRLAGFRDENNKAIQLASKSTDEFLSDAQALYDEVKNWSGDKTSDEYLAKQLRLGKTLTALRSSLPRTYSGKNGYTKAEEWANYLSENGLSGAMESSIKNQKNLKAVIENGVAVVAEEVVEQGVEEGKKVVIESQPKSTSKKQKYAGGLTWSKTKDAIKNGANKPEDGLSLEEYITKAQSLYNEINSWIGEKNIEYFSKRLELGSVMQKAAVAVKQANPDKKFKNTDLYNYFAKQYDMENVNSLALTATKLDGNKEIMAALADVKPVDTTPITQAVENADNAVVEHVAETASAVGEGVKSKKTEISDAEKYEMDQFVMSLAESALEEYLTGKLSLKHHKMISDKDLMVSGLSSLSHFFGVDSEDIIKAMNLSSLSQDVLNNINGTDISDHEEDIVKPIMQNIISVLGTRTAKTAWRPLTKQSESLVQEAVEDGAEKIVQKSTDSAQQAISQGVEETELSDAKKLKLAKKELQNRIDTAKEIAQDGTKSKSKEVIKSGSVPSAQNQEYVFNEGVESTSEFVKEVWNLTEAFKAGANAANIEYGFATQNGKRIQLAKGDNGSVDFQRFYGDVDSLTHSHSYTKGLNNMVFSLEDINQLEQLGTRNNLKKYNLIYDNEMMSLNLGKNSQEAAEAIADCYPQINDVVMAMLSREDGNSIPAENTEEMARILNGYLQKVVEDAGGRLSVVNSKGENVTSKYSITDDEYNKLNNILAKSQNYYNDNFGTVSKSDYVSVIRQYIAEEFGKEFMANVRAKSDANPHGGVYTEFSAIPEYDDEDKKMLDYAEQVTLYSKKIVAAEKAFVESLQKMSNEDLMDFIKQGEKTLGIKKEPEVKPTLTKAQISALNPDDVTALQKASIKQFSKARNWNENNVGNIERFLGTDNKTLVAYKTQFEELAKIALDLKAKGESGTIITKDDISQLDVAISKTKELQTVLTKEAQFKQMKDAGLIVNGKTKIKPTDTYSDRQAIMSEYAKKYAAQNKSEYQFGQYDFINDKISFNMIDSAGKVTKTVMGWSDAFNTAYIQSSKLQGSLDKITQEIYKTDEAIKSGEDYGFFKGQSDGVKEYNDALKEYEAQVRAVAKSSQKDLDKNFEALHAAQVKVINAGKNLLDKQKDAFGFNSAQKVLGREGNIDATLQSYRDQGINVDDIKLVKNYNDAIGALKQKLDELKQSGKLWDSNEQAGLKVLADHAAEAEKAILKADEAQRQIKGDLIIGAEAKFFEGVDPKDIKQVEQAMKQYARSIKGVDALSIKWNEEQRTLTYSVRTGKHEVSDFALTMGKYTDACYKARTGTRTVQTGMEKFLTSIKGKFQEVARYIISFGSFYRIWAEIQKGVTYVREIDSALTELKKVTDETDETYAKFLKTMAQTGSEVGATVQDLTNMAASWARLGYSIEQAGELAKSTAVLLNVSEFTDADTASEALISTIQAYGYAAEDSMHVIDVLNEIGNNFAISSDGIATALQDSASSLMAAGNNLEQSVAMIAAANKVLQDPNSVGAALRTISLRIRGTSVKVLEEMGEETDGVIESVSKLQAKVKGLSGVDILTDTGAYKDTYTVIKEIAQVWDQMNDIDRAALLELLAGKNRSNAMAAMLTNLEDLEGAYESAMEAQGSAEAENEKYLNSIQGKIELFTNSLQVMWQNAISSEFVKFIVSLGTSIVRLVDQIGMIPSVLAGIVAFKGFSSLVKHFGDIKAAISLIAEESVRTGKTIFEVSDSVGLLSLKAKLASGSLIEFAVKNKIVQASEISTMTTTQLLGVAFQGLILKIKNAVKAMWAFAKANPWIGIAAIATIATIAITALTKTHQDYVKELKETSDEISDVKSNLSSLEDELKSVSDRIDELNSKDKLSFTEKEELKNLKAQNAELERSIRLEEQKENRLQKKAAKQLENAVKSDYSINGKATVYKNSKGEYVSQTLAVDQSANNYAPGNEKLNDGYSKETVSSIQVKIIEYERTQKELEEAKNELLKLGDDATDKEVKNAQAKVDRLQKSVDNSYDIISNTMDKFQEDYLSQEGVEWQYGNPDELEDWQKQMNANLKIIYDAQDKLAIGADNTGKAIKSAFSRVTLQTEFQDELDEIQNEAGITGEKLKEMYEADNSTDNTGMKSFIQSLIDCGVIANASAEELQKVVDLSLELGDSSSDAATANKKLARSQKMLEYSRLYKELHKYTDALRDGCRSTGELSAQDKKSVQAIREKMAALSEEISKYDILGDQINEAKEAFENFESAKTADSDSDYLSSAGEMFQEVIDGYQSAEMGSETFKSAFKALIPESVYEDFDTLEAKYDAAAEYISGTLSRYFKIEYDDDGAIESVETTTKNIETFIEDAKEKEKGLMSFSDGVWTVEETNFKKFADKMGITEEMLVAIGTQMDKIDADWITGDNSSFFDSFDMGTEANIYKTTKALADLDQQFIDTANNEKLTAEERQKAIDDYVAEYTRLQNELSQNKENAINDIINYDNATKQVDNLQSQLQKATEELSKLKNDPNATEDQIAEAAKNANEIATNLQTALQNKSALEKPSQVLVEFAVANIEDEKAKIVAELGTIDASIKLTTTDKDGKEQINSSIIKQLDDGTYSINVDANLTEESKAKVQSYVDLLNKEAQINSYVEGDQGAKESADNLKKTYEDLSQVIKDLPSPKINTFTAQTAVNTLKQTVDNLKDSFDDLPTEVTTTVTTINRTVNETVERKSTGFGWLDKLLGFSFDGNAHFDGAANASGTLGAEKTETSLVGELGPELRVRGNRWEMLGENGAEFADVKKGDIIFNHKQTEELIKNGHISSRGKAFVGGTAYNGTGTSGTIFTKYATKNGYGGKVPDWYGHADLLYDSANAISDAADDVSDAADEFKEVFDWFEILLEEIENNISLMNAKLENTIGISAKKGIYSEIINTEQFKLQELYEGVKLYSDYANKLLAKVPDQYKEMAKNGAVAITNFLGETNEEVVESINNYREWANKVTDLNQQLEETKKTIADTHVEIQSMVKDEYDNRISLITSVNDRIQETIDLLDEEGKRSSAVMYEEMIKNSTRQLSELQNKRVGMQKALDEAVTSGNVKKESSQWYEMVNAISDVDSEINDCRISLEGFQNSINQLHWDNFEKLIDAIDNVGNEISNLSDLIDEEDVVDEIGNWTKKGITALGLYAQEMERAKYRAEQYGKEIEYLNQEYAAGKYSVDEYNEKLQELRDGQWDSIKSYEAAKKAIVDLNKTRVEAIKNGIEKEISAYQELIDKKKEELQLQKDSHDFSKQVAEQQKNIADLQKKLAVMAGDNSASAIAQKKQLQAELAAAQEELDELYYSHSVEKQGEALDKQLESYQDSKDKEMEQLDESLKNEEQVIADSYATIAANTESVAQTLAEIASQYGITLSDSVTKPWLDGANAIGTYKEQLDTSMSSFTKQLESLRQMYVDLQNQADSTGKSMISAINGNKSKTESATYTPPKPSKPSTPSKPSKPSAPSVGASVTVKKSAKNFSRDGGNGTRMQSWVPGSTFTVYQVSGSEVLIGRNGGYTGWVKLSDIQGYSSGIKKVPNDQFAMIDELGLEELVLHADGNGKLAFLSKGTSVIPSDITENLMKLGTIDPTTMLERNKPSIGAPHITNNNMEINMEFGSLVHVDTVNKDTLPDLQKMVRSEFDNCMKNINQGLKRYTR